MARMKKTTQGHKKIAIEKIASEDARQVCFSKRRSGLFTKATDLATLCGAEVAILVDSPAGNTYSFGNPGVNEVADRFLSGNTEPGSGNAHPGTHVDMVQVLNQQCMDLSGQMKSTIARKSMFDARAKTLVQENQICQWAEDIEGLELTQLLKLEESLVGFKVRLQGRVSELRRGGGASSSNVVMAARPLRALNPYAFGTNQACLGSNMGYVIGFIDGNLKQSNVYRDS